MNCLLVSKFSRCEELKVASGFAIIIMHHSYGSHKRANLTFVSHVPEPCIFVFMRQGFEREKLRLTLALQALRQAHAFHTFSWQGGDVDALMTPAERMAQAIEAAQARVCGCSSHTHTHADAAAAVGDTHNHTHATSADAQPHVHNNLDNHQHHHGHSNGVETGLNGESNGDSHAAVAAAPAVGAVQPQPVVDEEDMLEELVVVGSAAAAGGHVHRASAVPEAAAVPEATEVEFNAAVSEAVQRLDSVVMSINDVLDEFACAIEELEDAGEV